MANLPTIYEHYTGSGITSGLSANQTYFTLNNKNITIFSGALHYFRVPQEYWRDRLRKLKAAGLNTVETYIPWNLHEPQPGVYDFGNGGTDFQEFLALEKFLKLAQEEDLLAIIRPGPYICAEWEFGGMPSWLLKQNVKIRTSDQQFMDFVSKYFVVLFSILSTFQFSKGGPIIAFQIENEYGNTQQDNLPVDTNYLEMLKDAMIRNGVVELMFTSDTPLNGNSGSLPGILNTANFQYDADKQLSRLLEYQPNKPLMVMEYWTGWFDHWTEQHHTRTDQNFSAIFEDILKFPASVNMYMFHGGTNWGFMNGGNILDISTDNGGYLPDTSSYDYDAPLTEAGDYTDKYYTVQRLIAKYNTVQTKLPSLPIQTPRIVYEDVIITKSLPFSELLQNAEHHIQSSNVMPMESLPINNNSGQSYGYVVYRKKNLNISPNSLLKIEGRVCDTALILINGELKSRIPMTLNDLNTFGFWKVKDAVLDLGETCLKNATLDIVVENFGRSNFGKLDQFNQHKGLWQGNVLINDKVVNDWEIIPLEFKKKWTNSLHFSDYSCTKGPTLFKGVLDIKVKQDTYIDMRKWVKGIVIVNGFVLSRYFNLGPQQCAYLPAPLLKLGKNDIIIFEHYKGDDKIKFQTNQIYFTNK